MHDGSGLRSVVVNCREPGRLGSHRDRPLRRRLVSLGARMLGPHPGGERWTVMADPERNEFCVFPLTEEA